MTAAEVINLYTELEDLKIRVTKDAMTVIDPAGAPMQVATKWKDLDGYRDFLVNTLLSK